MTSSENYIHYNNNGDGRRDLSVGSRIAIGILAVFLISMFSLVGSCVNTYNKLIDMEEDVNLAFANVQSVMQNRIEKIPDMVKVTDEAAEHLETIYANIADGRKAMSASSTPEEFGCSKCSEY